MEIQPSQKIGVSTLVFITMASIVSPIGMVIMAKYGISSIFYYALVVVLFFIPSAWVCSELGAAWPEEGGMYRWVSQAFGRQAGNIAVWAQWISVIVSFPVIITFVSDMLAYAFKVNLSHHGGMVFVICLILTLFSTIISIFGIRMTTLASALATFASTVIPVSLLIIFAIIWLVTGHHAATSLSLSQVLPSNLHLDNFSLLGATVFMFAGIEIAAYCLKYVRNPKRDYPRAMFLSSMIIISLSVLGTIAISLLVETKHVSLIAAIMQAFSNFLIAYHCTWLLYVLAIMMALGSLGVIATYIATLARGLLASSQDHLLPRVLTKINRYDVPANIILLQGVVALALSLLYIFVPRVNAAYWMIEAIVAIAGALRYLFLFAAAIRLRYTKGDTPRIIRIPGGNWGIWVVAGAGFLMCAFAIAMTFIPPEQFSIGSHSTFEWVLGTGILACFIVPYAVGYLASRDPKLKRMSHSRNKT